MTKVRPITTEKFLPLESNPALYVSANCESPVSSFIDKLQVERVHIGKDRKLEVIFNLNVIAAIKQSANLCENWKVGRPIDQRIGLIQASWCAKKKHSSGLHQENLIDKAASRSYNLVDKSTICRPVSSFPPPALSCQLTTVGPTTSTHC